MATSQTSVVVAHCVQLILSVFFIVNIHFEAGVEIQPFLFEVGDVGGHRSGVDYIFADVQD